MRGSTRRGDCHMLAAGPGYVFWCLAQGGGRMCLPQQLPLPLQRQREVAREGGAVFGCGLRIMVEVTELSRRLRATIFRRS